MTSVPERPADDPVASRLSDEHDAAVERLDRAMARLLARYWLEHGDDERRADAVDPLAEHHDELEGLGRDCARLLAALWLKKHSADQPAEPSPQPRRQRKPKPSRLAKWETQWQADAEAER